ncbi:putative Neutral alpha-glucosidase AB [Blattamonas nauphoetae]|uniref:Glucosidase II subunit alpha n=1 Tax=Blattamonas nauphoetae TaxID=2049346 RepID=A0ABQ9YFD9_9EUKA|nr:putative Neutral alpha-glucosidase AB [Blattamonas nauphoetae]
MALLAFASFIVSLHAIDRTKFKTFEESSFYRRNRCLAPGAAPFRIKPEIQIFEHSISGTIENTLEKEELMFSVFFFQNGLFRFTLFERNGLFMRLPLENIVLDTLKLAPINASNTGDILTVLFAGYTFTIDKKRFLIELTKDGVPVMQLNKNKMFNFEHYRERPAYLGEPQFRSSSRRFKETTQQTPPTIAIRKKPLQSPTPGKYPAESVNLWEETWRDFVDSKPRGPSSLGIEISFPSTNSLYGLPQRSCSTRLPVTKGPGSTFNEPIRLYNTDVYQYEMNSLQPLYGSVPFIFSRPLNSSLPSCGFLWINAADTWVDIQYDDLASPFEQVRALTSHFISEAGRMDFIVIPGNNTRHVMQSYKEVTGSTFLPPLHSLGYHQSRWNYFSSNEVVDLLDAFHDHDVPFDNIWLDIEHTDRKHYFTWNQKTFPDPVALQQKLALSGHRLVAIADPHLAVDPNYWTYSEAFDNGYFIRTSDGETPFEGQSWPGRSSWPDFVNPSVRKWWGRIGNDFGWENEGIKTTPILSMWNDMNEPSVSSGEEFTMAKDCIHIDGREHREVHNAYGHYLTMASHLLQQNRIFNSKENALALRPFILSRSFFAGTQRYAAVWTGDNQASWAHLKGAVEQLLTLSMSGIPFVGTDIGGFFNNPEKSLLVRWYQFACFTPFFRSHGHLETRHKEPWVFDSTTFSDIRDAIKLRYRLLPYLYTEFFNTIETGVSPMRPIWLDHISPANNDKDIGKYERQEEESFMLGDSLFVVPILEPGEIEKRIVFPFDPTEKSTFWYNFHTGRKYSTDRSSLIPISSRTIPVFQKGGSIVPLWNRERRSSFHMLCDPLTLVVCPSKRGRASGTVFLDDGETHGWSVLGNCAVRTFRLTMRKTETNETTQTEPTSDNSTKPEEGYVLTISNTARELPATFKERHVTSSDYYAPIQDAIRTALLSSTKRNPTSNATIASLFKIPDFPPFETEESPPVHVDWEAVQQQSRVECLLVRGMKAPPKKAQLVVEGEEPVDLECQSNPTTRTIFVALPKAAKTLQNWIVEVEV